MPHRQSFARKLRIYTDGAIRPEAGVSGLAAIARDPGGRIFYWWNGRAGVLTCNEAEYAAAIFALEQLLKMRDHQRIEEIEICSDSKVMVDQMSGRAVAHAPSLRQAMTHLRALAAQFPKISFRHIPREHNRLADALAYEAINGDYAAALSQNARSSQSVGSASPAADSQLGAEPLLECPYPETWEQLIRLWSKS